MKLSRRNLLATALSAPAAPLAAQAPTPPQPPTPEADLAAARENLARTSETLKNFKLPMAAEPAFRFEA